MNSSGTLTPSSPVFDKPFLQKQLQQRESLRVLEEEDGSGVSPPKAYHSEMNLLEELRRFTSDVQRGKSAGSFGYECKLKVAAHLFWRMLVTLSQ